MVWRFQIRQSRHFNALPRKSKRLRLNIMLPTFSFMSHFHSFFLVIAAFFTSNPALIKFKNSVVFYFYLDLFPYMEYLDVSS
jgi:hypothetical protein